MVSGLVTLSFPSLFVVGDDEFVFEFEVDAELVWAAVLLLLISLF